MPDKFPLGRFVWYELLTTDPAAAVPFYSDLIGWGTRVDEGVQPPYTMWTLDGVPLGGIMRLPDEAVAGGERPSWLAYIATPDVDATVRRAAELGAQVRVPPTDVPTAGRFSVIADPQGATFAAYTPAGEPGSHDGESLLGECSWHELATTDREAAFAFYQDLFGWEPTETVEMPQVGTYPMFRRADTELPLGGMYDKPAGFPGPSGWLHYWRIEDVHAGAKKVERLGGKIVNGPLQIPDGDWIVICLDPQGAAFAIHHLPPES